ncbi:alpha/beta fold hydrolase [Leptolyngbya sp. AN02str]|uniref:alpha/beta fold hydrolase n=1 Tax=Leptolyngbya sp. AN02str TaxID=3423363 RepID=UPI003D316E70
MIDKIPDVVWLNVSPALARFHHPVMKQLSHQSLVAFWEYVHNQDEANSLEDALEVLHRYLSSWDEPVHLVGHSTSGTLGLLYAQKFPEKVRSLTLLSVGIHPLIDWQAHYYNNRRRFHCARELLLAQMGKLLFGDWSRLVGQRVIELLDADLNTSLSPHTLYHVVSMAPVSVSVPLLVCGGQIDGVLSPHEMEGWRSLFSTSVACMTSRLWLCANEGHFFHYFRPELTACHMQSFWQSIQSAYCRSAIAIGS